MGVQCLVFFHLQVQSIQSIRHYLYKLAAIKIMSACMLHSAMVILNCILQPIRSLLAFQQFNLEISCESVQEFSSFEGVSSCLLYSPFLIIVEAGITSMEVSSAKRR